MDSGREIARVISRSLAAFHGRGDHKKAMIDSTLLGTFAWITRT